MDKKVFLHWVSVCYTIKYMDDKYMEKFNMNSNGQRYFLYPNFKSTELTIDVCVCAHVCEREREHMLNVRELAYL